MALEPRIGHKSAEHHDWQRVRHIAPHSPWRAGMRNRANSERVVPHHFLVHTDNICARGSACFVLMSASAQPFIQHRFSGVKVLKVMR